MLGLSVQPAAKVKRIRGPRFKVSPEKKMEKSGIELTVPG